MGEIIPFVPRNSTDRRPMLEQMAHEIVAQVTTPTPGGIDDLPWPGMDSPPYVAPADAIIDRISGWTRGAFTGWRGKGGDFKITLDEAEDHFSLCMQDMLDDLRAFLEGRT